MADMRAALAGFGAPPERIHMEIFNGSEAKSPGVVGAVKRTSHPPVSDSNTGSLVSFARSGIAAHWNPSAYQNILELAEACDVPVRWACRSGVCHSCESGLVSGAVAYAPDPSTDLLKAIFWFAAHNRFVTSSSICDASPRRNLRCISVQTPLLNTEVRPFERIGHFGDLWANPTKCRVGYSPTAAPGLS